MASEVCSMIHDLHLGDHSVGASEGDDALKTVCGDSSSKCGMTEESSQKVVTEEDVADEEFDDDDDDLVNKHVVTEEEIADADSDDEFWDKYWEDYCVKRCNPTREDIVEFMSAEYNRITCIQSLKDCFELSPMYDIDLENIGIRLMNEADFDESDIQLMNVSYVVKRVNGRYEWQETVTNVD